MQTGQLLEKLIGVTQASRTDLALHMNMSPSGLSKILTGARLPLQKEKRAFCPKAGGYFSGALWGPQCHAGTQAKAAMAKHPGFVDGLIHRGIDAAYTFMSLGFMLREEDLDGPCADVDALRGVLRLFDHVLASDIPLYITQDTVADFYKTGRLILPLTGSVNIPRHKRLAYLSRLDAVIRNRAPGSITILSSSMPRLAVMLSHEYTILYLTDSRFSYEKFHVLKTGAVKRGLARELASDRFNPLPLSRELWNSLLLELRATG